MKVQFEAIMWGVGTALGELPPFFVARAARLAGKRLEEEAEKDASADKVTNHSKIYIYIYINSTQICISIKKFPSLPHIG
jgi:hypothetical protein